MPINLPNLLQSMQSFSFIPDLNTTLLEIISQKNQKPRYNYNFDSLPTRFSPESPDYYSGLLMESWLAIIFSILSLLSLFLILYLRARFGYFGGKKLKNSEFTQFVRWTPGFLLSLSFLLFFLSATSLLIESQKITETSETLSSISSSFSINSTKIVKQTQNFLINFNMIHATHGNYFDSKGLESTVKELEISQKAKDIFQYELDKVNDRRVLVSLVLFALGLIGFFITVLTFVMKISDFGMFFAVVLGVFVALDFLVLIPYMMQRVIFLDFCEQIVECDLENSIPVPGHELGFYFFDFSQKSKQDLGIVEKQALELIANVQKQIFGIKEFGTGGGSGEIEENSIRNSLVLLQIVKKNVEKLESGYFIKEFCRDVDQKVCSGSFSSFLVAEFIIVVLAFSFGIGCLAGLLAPRVIERWKFEADQLALSKHNFYQLRNT